MWRALGEWMKQVIAVVFGVGLLCNALLFVSQVIAVWRQKSGAGVSLITFGGFNILQIVAITHGVYQHDLSLALGTAASLITSGAVTVLTIVYRIKLKEAV
jgi:MtN3 and saliva related transmembrane protein